MPALAKPPSLAWIAALQPLVDAPPEVREAVRYYISARLRYQADRDDRDAALQLDAVEHRIFDLAAYSRAHFVCDQVVAQVVYHQTKGYPKYVEVSARWMPLAARPGPLED